MNFDKLRSMNTRDFNNISQHSPTSISKSYSANGKLLESELKKPKRENNYISSANVFTVDEVDTIVYNNNQCITTHEGTLKRDLQEVERIKNIIREQESKMASLQKNLQYTKKDINISQSNCEEILERKDETFLLYEKYLEKCMKSFVKPMNKFDLKSPLNDDEFDLYIESPTKIKAKHENEIQILSTNQTNREITTQTCDANDEIKQKEISTPLHIDANLSKEELVSLYNELIPSIGNLEFKLDKINDAFSAENKKIKNFIRNLDKKHAKEYTCKKCYKKFKLDNNNEDSCKYHSGYLKYYSCRGCGADEYYTCCNKCSSCSEGCFSGKHAAILEEADLEIGV